MTSPVVPAATPERVALTPAEACASLGVSKATFYALLRRDAALRRCRRVLGARTVRYDAARLRRWFETRPDAAPPRKPATAPSPT